MSYVTFSHKIDPKLVSKNIELINFRKMLNEKKLETPVVETIAKKKNSEKTLKKTVELMKKKK